jgi:hypothetical protein
LKHDRLVAGLIIVALVVATILFGIWPRAPKEIMANTVVKLVLSKDVVEPGESFSMDVVIEPAAGANVAGAQLNIDFNNQSIQLDSVAEGDFLNQGGDPTYFNAGVIDSANGHLTNVYGAVLKAGAVLPNPGTFATIQCTAGQVPSTSSVVLSNVIVGNKDGVAVPLESLTPVEVVVALSADVNLDGVVDIADVEAVADEFGTTGQPGFSRADVDGDGVINILDIILVGQNFA